MFAALLIGAVLSSDEHFVTTPGFFSFDLSIGDSVNVTIPTDYSLFAMTSIEISSKLVISISNSTNSKSYLLPASANLYSFRVEGGQTCNIRCIFPMHIQIWIISSRSCKSANYLAEDYTYLNFAIEAPSFNSICVFYPNLLMSEDGIFNFTSDKNVADVFVYSNLTLEFMCVSGSRCSRFVSRPFYIVANSSSALSSFSMAIVPQETEKTFPACHSEAFSLFTISEFTLQNDKIASATTSTVCSQTTKSGLSDLEKYLILGASLIAIGLGVWGYFMLNKFCNFIGCANSIICCVKRQSPAIIGRLTSKEAHMQGYKPSPEEEVMASGIEKPLNDISP